VAFHVEISSGLRHARAFNLDRDELKRTILQPWLAGRPVALGEREWPPAKSRLKILEGPALDNPSLSYGQGWANAERASRNVTVEVVAAASRSRPPPPVTLLVEADAAEEAIAEMVEGRGARPLDPQALGDLIEAGDPAVAGIIVVVRR
jgi:hypothetical protein